MQVLKIYLDVSLQIVQVMKNYLIPTSSSYIDLPTTLSNPIIAEVTSNDFREMPWQLRKLQIEVMENLKPCYEAYSQQDIQAFYNAAVSIFSLLITIGILVPIMYTFMAHFF